VPEKRKKSKLDKTQFFIGVGASGEGGLESARARSRKYKIFWTTLPYWWLKEEDEEKFQNDGTVLGKVGGEKGGKTDSSQPQFGGERRSGRRGSRRKYFHVV